MEDNGSRRRQKKTEEAVKEMSLDEVSVVVMELHALFRGVVDVVDAVDFAKQKTVEACMLVRSVRAEGESSSAVPHLDFDYATNALQEIEHVMQKHLKTIDKWLLTLQELEKQKRDERI